ncbi:Transposase IS116/IS110/IS902 family protein [Bacteroidales bacterium Barb6XT]|nr:Transposase IS116/IS110/IS902 family protein [Bacteroidales bacterium Barb6XT]
MPAWQPTSLNYKELRDLCRELSSIKKDLTRAECQLHAMEHPHHKNARVTALKTRQIEFYTQAMEEIETEIRKLVEEDGELKEKVDRITKVKGLGLITVVIVLCETNGFRLFNNIRQAVSYAGPDVVLKESGKFKGRTRISKKGNAAIRQCLFMPALSAANHNKNMQTFYARIVEKTPQAKRKAIVACMRKLLTPYFCVMEKGGGI